VRSLVQRLSAYHSRLVCLYFSAVSSGVNARGFLVILRASRCAAFCANIRSLLACSRFYPFLLLFPSDYPLTIMVIIKIASMPNCANCCDHFLFFCLFIIFTQKNAPCWGEVEGVLTARLLNSCFLAYAHTCALVRNRPATSAFLKCMDCATNSFLLIIIPPRWFFNSYFVQLVLTLFTLIVNNWFAIRQPEQLFYARSACTLERGSYILIAHIISLAT